MKNFRKKANKIGSILLISFIISFSFIMFLTSRHYNKINLKRKYDIEFYNKERFFKSEIKPKNNEEEMIIEFFKIQISDEYNNFKDILIKNDYFAHYGELYKKKKDLGIYYDKVIIHEINELEEEIYSNKEDKERFYSYMDKLKKYNPSEFKIIEVKYSNKINEDNEDILKDNRLGSGVWTSYFVLAKKRLRWKIFDIYGHIQ